MNVCIYGDGHVAHSLAAKIADYLPVTIVLRFDRYWSRRLKYEQDGIFHESFCEVNATTDEHVARGADIIFIAVPQFAFENALGRLCPYLHDGQIVVAVPAPAKMAEYAKYIAKSGAEVVGFQRVPYISRIVKYGERVQISADRREHKCVVSNAVLKGVLESFATTWFGGTVSFLSSFLVFAFNNSNPLLHPSRMAVLFRDWRNHIFEKNPPFYAEWTDESSELYVAADCEMREVMMKCPGVDFKRDYESVLDHYGVETISELTQKIRSIPSFRSILSPMRELGGRFIPDFSSRYFTEDVAFGTRTIQNIARRLSVQTPTIDSMILFVEGLVKDA